MASDLTKVTLAVGGRAKSKVSPLLAETPKAQLAPLYQRKFLNFLSDTWLLSKRCLEHTLPLTASLSSSCQTGAVICLRFPKFLDKSTIHSNKTSHCWRKWGGRERILTGLQKGHKGKKSPAYFIFTFLSCPCCNERQFSQAKCCHFC